MEKIFEHLNDLHVKSYVVYAKAADGKLYYDAAFTATKQVKQADIEDAFAKGILLIVNGTEKLMPLALNGNIVTTICKTGAGSDAFDADDTYAIGAMVTKDGKVYKCKTAIESATAWDASKWDEVKSANVVEWAALATT